MKVIFVILYLISTNAIAMSADLENAFKESCMVLTDSDKKNTDFCMKIVKAAYLAGIYKGDRIND